MTAWPASLRAARPPRKPPGTAAQGFGQTSRADDWWSSALGVGFWLAVLVVYSAFSAMLWRPLFGVAYEVDGYASPFFFPLFRDVGLPLGVSPAILTLWIPVGFRVTCYYFRRAYYRSFFLDPPACAVAEARKGYSGERAFPFVLQNLHRYLLYLALVFMIVHWTNTVRAFTFDGRFGVGLGSLILLADTTLLSLYTLGCHAFRHMIGGSMDCYSCVRGGEARRKAWSLVSLFNGHHMGYFWWSLYTICFADLYIRMCAIGIWHDPRLF